MTLERPMFPPRAAVPAYIPTDISPTRLFMATSAPGGADILRVGSLELDRVNRTGKRGNRSFDLRAREVRLLEYMMRHAGELLTREMLFRDVWHYNFIPESNLVDVHMGKLRRKVDGSDEAPMIRNVRGEGFILNVFEAALRRR